jgi:preprotein translocase SecE subunit
MAGQPTSMATERQKDASEPGGGRSAFRLDIYKRGQGTPTRAFIFIALALVWVTGCRWLYYLPGTGTAWYEPVWLSGGPLIALGITAAVAVALYRVLLRGRTDREILRWGALTGGISLAGAAAWLLNTRALATVEVLSRPWTAEPIPAVNWGVVISAMAFVYGLWALYRVIVNHPGRADFLIETETELRKVAWPTRREYVGSSIVVIVIVALLSLYLTAVDVVLNRLMMWLGIGY